MSLRFLFPAVAALLLAPAPAVRGAVAITDTHVTNIGTTTFSVVWMTSEVSTPALEVYSDAAGTIAITSTLGLEYYPIAEGDPRLINTSAARAGQRALEVLAINRRVVVVRVTGLASATTYYVRPRTFDTSGSDNGMGPVPLVAATTAEFSSLVVDARLVRIRFPAFPSEGMVAVLEGPAGSTKLSAIVGDSTDADAVVFPLANIMEAAQRTNALYNAPQPITVRVIGAGAPAGSFTRTIDFGGTFKVAGYQAIDADLASPAPYFTTQPADQSVVVGANATFTVVAAGTPAPAVKW